MRNFKRTLALVLAVIMVIGTFATVSAASTKWYDEAVEMLDNAGISNIGKDAAAPLTRNEFVMWIAKIESLQLSEDAWNDEIASVVFTDVTEAHHRAAIAYSYKANFIIGNGDGTFAPDKTLSLAEASAVIVRLMRYESKVNGLAGEWDVNYMRVASMYCRAFDQVFYKNSNTYDPDYQLTKGETAYILATILNFINRDEDDLIKTADGIDLGARFENVTPAAKENVYYIANLNRKAAGTQVASVYLYGTSNGTTWPAYTNEFDTASNVTLISADGKNVLTISGAEFVKMIRVSLGLAERNDYMNEEAEINIFETVRVGTMVEFVAEPEVLASGVVTSYKNLKNFKVSANSVVVDTVLQATMVTSTYESLLGYAAASIGTKLDYRPTLPTTYDATKATSWTNIVYDENGAIVSATLNFKGVAYEYGTDIVAYDANWEEMDVATAVNSIINVAQGEMFSVFNDVDGDGLYDTIFVKESYAFAYTAAPNIASVNSTSQDYMTSLSNGAVVGQATPKYNSLGSVIWNQTVGYSNSSYERSSTDPYTLTASATGKLQLVLCAANAHPITKWNASNDTLCYYTVVDLAAFYTGIIEEVDVHAVEGYYTAKVKTTAGNYVTVYIPVEAEEKVELDVTIAGVTAAYTFDCSKWGSFMTDTKNAALNAGIAMPENVVNGNSEEYLAYTAAWMAGKYVEFATTEDNVVFCINGTEATTGTTGFVSAVAATETGDNTYNVTVAVTGASAVANAVATPYYYYLKTLANSANYVASLGTGGIKNGAHCNTGNRDAYLTKIDGEYGVDADGDGVLDRDAEGYLIDMEGKKFIQAQITHEKYSGVASFKTVEVRASASGMFDWANYNVYNSLFKGSIVDPNFVNSDNNGKVNAGTDLVYVTIMKDAGSLNYILYNSYADRYKTDKTSDANQGSGWYTNSTMKTPNGDLKWYYAINKATLALNAEDSWQKVTGEHIIALEKIEGTETIKIHENGVQYKEALYNAAVGYNPYYFRTWNAQAKTYTYELGFGLVEIYTNVVGTADAIIDTESTLMIPLYAGETGETSVQVKATKAEDIAKYEAMGCWVDTNGLVFILLDSQINYKKDAKGNIVYDAVEYDWANAEVEESATDMLFKDIQISENEVQGAYATLTITDKPKTDDGWFPGSYYVVIDGVKYNVTGESKILVITPSSTGFTTSTKTVAELIATGKTKFFVTEWSAAVAAQNVVANFAIVGTDNLAKVTIDNGSSDNEEAKTVLVYLENSAKAVIRQDEFSKEWLVISDKSAVALPTGEEVGAIYRSYPTYAEAVSANLNINLSVAGGAYYLVDEHNEIVSATTVETLRGQITDVKADGTTIATMNGEKGVDISKINTEFFFVNTDGNLVIAGDSTNVTIISEAAYADLFKTKVEAVEKAQAAYDTAKAKYDEGNLSDARLAYYADALAAAEKDLVDAKAASLDKYFNGQFWGFANSPVFKYVTMAQGTFQEGKPTLYFDYIVVDDTLCVFTDSFGFEG